MRYDSHSIDVQLCLYSSRTWATTCRPFVLKVARPLDFCRSCVCHLPRTTLRGLCFSVDFKECRTGGCRALDPGRLVCLNPVASLAVRSAALLPFIPLWAGICRISTLRFCARKTRTRCVMVWRRYVPDVPLGIAADRMAAWLSLYFSTFFLLFRLFRSSWAIWRAMVAPALHRRTPWLRNRRPNRRS
jgi:hypothetical protein